MSSTLVAWLVVAVTAPDAGAAFEWSHRTARSWMIGIHAARWPAADWLLPAGQRVIRCSARRSGPWGWPDLRAVAIDCGWRGRSRSGGLAASQLRVDGYRESRWTGLVGTRVGRSHWIALSWSGLIATSPAAGRSGHELALGWRVTGSGWYAAVAAHGVWRSAGARDLRPPRDFTVLLGRRVAVATFEGLWRENDLGNLGRLGAAIRISRCCEIRTAVASEEPHLRWGAGLELGGLHLDVAWLLHGDLPPTQVIEIGWEATRR